MYNTFSKSKNTINNSKFFTSNIFCNLNENKILKDNFSNLPFEILNSKNKQHSNKIFKLNNNNILKFNKMVNVNKKNNTNNIVFLPEIKFNDYSQANRYEKTLTCLKKVQIEYMKNKSKQLKNNNNAESYLDLNKSILINFLYANKIDARKVLFKQMHNLINYLSDYYYSKYELYFNCNLDIRSNIINILNGEYNLEKIKDLYGKYCIEFLNKSYFTCNIHLKEYENKFSNNLEKKKQDANKFYNKKLKHKNSDKNGLTDIYNSFIDKNSQHLSTNILDTNLISDNNLKKNNYSKKYLSIINFKDDDYFYSKRLYLKSIKEIPSINDRLNNIKLLPWNIDKEKFKKENKLLEYVISKKINNNIVFDNELKLLENDVKNKTGYLNI